MFNHCSRSSDHQKQCVMVCLGFFLLLQQWKRCNKDRKNAVCSKCMKEIEQWYVVYNSAYHSTALAVLHSLSRLYCIVTKVSISKIFQNSQQTQQAGTRVGSTGKLLSKLGGAPPFGNEVCFSNSCSEKTAGISSEAL